MIKVYEYTDYREYLQDYYRFMKERKDGYSYRYFSKLAGSGSPSWLRFVMNGERNLSEKAIDKFIHALRLKKREAAYFKALVLFNQAEDEAHRDIHYAEMVSCAYGAAVTLIGRDLYEFYGTWYYSAIRQMVELPGFREDPAWIAERLVPNIKMVEAKVALRKLKDWGFIRYDKQGRLIQSDPHIATADEVKSGYVRRFHRQMGCRAQDALDLVPRQEREISGVTMTVSSGCKDKIKKYMVEFEKKLQDLIEHDEGTPEEVYQFNLQFFPLVKTAAMEKEGRDA